jgi:hypothetical protein
VISNQSSRSRLPLTATSIKNTKLRARFPLVARRIDETITRIAADSRLVGCAHFSATPSLFACTIHPAAGPMCLRCAVDHVSRHTFEAEHTCDECGELAPTMRGLAASAESRGLEVSTRSGRRLRVVGPVRLFGLGVCDRCYRERMA